MKTEAVWADLLTPEERAALDPGLPDSLNRRPDVLVVGGGVVGAATALACQRAGFGSVMLIERERLGSGATGGAGGLLIPEALRSGFPPSYLHFGQASLALWWDLEASVPGGVGVTDLDWLRLEPFPADLLDGLPASAERLSPDDVARLVPALAQPSAGLLVHHQVRINPLRAVAHLAAEVSCVATGVQAQGVTVQGDRLTSVSTSAGELTPGIVIFATGVPPTIEGLDLAIPFGQIKGHIITTEPGEFGLSGTVAPVATRLDDGRLLAGGTMDVGDTSSEVRPEVIAAVRAELETALPALTGVPFSHGWCCFRPTHPDGLPVVDRVPGLANAWITSGHFRHGILMAPATGRALADWVATGQQPAEVVGLEAGRFADVNLDGYD